MQHYYEHGRNPIGLGHPARLLRWRYGPAGDSAPRLRLKRTLDGSGPIWNNSL